MLTNAAGSKNSNRGKAAASDEFSPVEAFVPRQTLNSTIATGALSTDAGRLRQIFHDHGQQVMGRHIQAEILVVPFAVSEVTQRPHAVKV